MKSSFHEPVLLDIMVVPKAQVVPVSRRICAFDRAKLTNPEVQREVRKSLAAIHVPPIAVEQTSRSHYVSEAIKAVRIAAAPRSQRTAKKHWVSCRSLITIEYRDCLQKRVRQLGRALKKLMAAAGVGGSHDVDANASGDTGSAVKASCGDDAPRLLRAGAVVFVPGAPEHMDGGYLSPGSDRVQTCGIDTQRVGGGSRANLVFSDDAVGERDSALVGSQGFKHDRLGSAAASNA